MITAMRLPNLAGLETCDQEITKEFEQAGIEIVQIGRMYSEVPASIIGKCNNFIFRRAWYYWMVDGYMPLENANYIYDKFRHLMVRVNGNHEDTKPIEWCEPRDYKKLIDKPVKDHFLHKIITREELEAQCNELKKGDQFVTSYHIDTQEGLNMFVRVIKENNIIG